ncbi:MAG: PEP-CTERM sorting domain-containing protein [Planctomycetaceae bacterium]
MGKLAYLLLSVLSLVLIPGVASAITTDVPEPTSLFLIMAGLLGIFGFRWIFKK